MQKALAIVLLVKSRLDRTQTIHNYTINKISQISGIAHTTIKKYLPIMKQMGLVAICGHSNEHIVFKSLNSHTSNRNISVEQFKFDDLQSVLRSIQAYIAILIQARKAHIKHTIQISKNPKNGKDFKSAWKEVKRLVKIGVLNDAHNGYCEYGISYKRFAKEIGVCEKTAFDVINFAVKNNWLQKQRNVEQVFAPKVNFRKVVGFTFSTKNNLYKVKANTYTITNDTTKCITSGNIRL